MVEMSVKDGKPPIAKFVGNAKRKLLLMPAEMFSDLQREKGSFNSKH
jgi:hypothetical protein